MKNKPSWLAFAVVLLLGQQFCTAQPAQPVGQTNQPPLEDFKPASTNQRGKDYPQVNSERRVRARISAPQAQSVQLEINGKRFPMTRDTNGVWTGDSTPFDEGNHYYGLVIDGAEVPDPGSTYIFGSGSWRNDIEIPASDQDFYALKNVPHGRLSEINYFGKTSNTNRHCFVYTPPDYDKDVNKRYPVLYLQHGYNEAESGWGAQGHVGLILDNLLAEGKARPFIIVMENGGISGGPGGRGARPAGAPTNSVARGTMGGVNFGSFEQVLLQDVIPYVDSNFRTIADQPHRAMAGLSMGGMQTRQITLAHLDIFSAIGLFSGGIISTNDVNSAPGFKEKVKVLFISCGSEERPQNILANHDALNAIGIQNTVYVSPSTAHEWQTWRRSFHEFAPLLFKD